MCGRTFQDVRKTDGGAVNGIGTKKISYTLRTTEFQSLSTGSQIFQKWKLKIICSRRFVPKIFISKNNQIKTDFLFQLVYNEFHILNRK